VITIVGSARGSASLPNKNSVPSTKIAGYDKHTSCATSTAATKTSIIETIQCYIARTFDKQHGRIEGTWKVHQTSITINGIIFQPSTSIKCKTATLSSFDRTIINNRRRDHPSAHHRCSSPYTIAARPTQLCTVSYGPCTNKYEGDGQPSYIMHPQEIII